MCLTLPTEGFPWDNLRKIFRRRQRMAKVPNAVETLPKISTAWVGHTSVANDRQTKYAYSQRKREFTFAKNRKPFRPDQDIYGRPFVKRFALCYQTVVCLSCLSVTLVYRGQTVGWIKMKLGMQPHCVRWGLSSPSPKGTVLNFRPISVVAKWLDGLRCHLVCR